MQTVTCGVVQIDSGGFGFRFTPGPFVLHACECQCIDYNLSFDIAAQNFYCNVKTIIIMLALVL